MPWLPGRCRGDLGTKRSAQRARGNTEKIRTTLPVDADAGFGVGEDFADLDGGDSGLVKSACHVFAFGRADQQTTGGLGVVEDGAEVFWYVGIVFDEAFG